jgi:CRISPR-associated protein Csb1
MADTLKALIHDADLVAITFRQTLAPVEGPGTPIFPATYPPPKQGKSTGPHLFGTPYTINKTTKGELVADIDSVQSQANRMESAFSGPLKELVPQHEVKAGEHLALLTDLPHRIADAAIRATDLGDAIHQAMLAYAKGDPKPLAKLAPTSLVYGAWDSRDTHVKVPRAIRSEIRAFDCSVFTRSAQFSGAFSQEELGLTDEEWKVGADVGFAPTPSVNAHGGVLVHGEIVHAASILLPALRRYVTKDDDTDDTLASYLLGLALAGLLHASDNYNLRAGCWLVRAGETSWKKVKADGSWEPFTIDSDTLKAEAKRAAEIWAESAQITLEKSPEIHEFKIALGKKVIEDEKKKKKKAGQDQQ